MIAIRRRSASVAAIILVIVAQRASAQQPIVADVAAPWTHAQTGLTMPPVLAGFDRRGIDQYDTDQRDIAAYYHDDVGRTETTLYAFYAGFPDVSVWHDRIKDTMSAGLLGQPDFAHALNTTFAAPGETVAGGLRTTATMAGKNIVASGLAIFSHDGWLIAVRMSSGTLDRDALDRRLAAFVAALPLAPAKAKPLPAFVVAPCASPLAPQGAALVPATPAFAIALGIGSVVMDKPSPVDLHSGHVADATDRYCRDPASRTNYGIYRLNGATDSYVLALSDAGTAAFVSPDRVLTEIRKGAKSYTVIMATVSLRAGLAVFDGLPAYAQTIDRINAHKPLVTVNRTLRPDEKTNINISTDNVAKKAD